MLHANRIAALAILTSTVALTAPAAAQSVEEFYKGKTLQMIVGYAPGGGQDTNARLLSRHITRHVPSSPSIVVQNMPGASSLKAAQHLNSGAPADGTVIAAIGPGLVIQSLTDPAQYKIKMTDYAWIGSLSQEVRVCYVRSAMGIKSWDDFVKHPGPINIGETGRGSGGYINWRMMQEIFGVKVKLILGYPGGNESVVAIERGELDGDCISSSSVPKNWLSDGTIKIVVKLSPLPLEGLPSDVPYVLDMTDDPAKKQLIKFLLSTSIMARPTIAAKAVPADRLAALRKAFDDTVKDPQLLEEANKLGRPVEGPLSGEDAAKLVEEIYASPPELVAAARDIVN